MANIIAVYEEEVAEIRANTVASKSRGVYLNSTAKFLAWVFVYKRQLLTDPFTEALTITNRNHAGALLEVVDDQLSSSSSCERRMKLCLQQNPRIPPIRFEMLTAHDFCTWLVSLRKKDGEKPGYATFNSHRAGLFNLFRDHGKTMSREMERELTNHYRGFKRRSALSIHAGEARCKVGKDPLPFQLYAFRILSLHMLQWNHRDFIFGRTFLILCWNLMARAANAFSICFEHMEFSEDALQIYFAHMKNDQFGERPRDPRHVYANPVNPAVCPLLALGVYWLCFPFSDQQTHLFPGRSQYDRFRKVLQKCLERPEVLKELSRHSITAEDLGSHSVRKGAATFASSGSTSCPSSTAIHLRAGWALGGVQDTYLRYESAGDMHVGRTVCGLPANSPDFALLPPRFMDCSTELVSEGVRLCFPSLPPKLKYIAEHALASVLYHTTFLINTLPSNHLLLTTAAFRKDSTVINQLRQKVVCTHEDNTVRATGIPPHITVKMSVEENTKALVKLTETVHVSIEQQRQATTVTFPECIKEKMVEVLDERAVTAGNMTYRGISESFTQCLRTHGISGTGISSTASSNVVASNNGICDPQSHQAVAGSDLTNVGGEEMNGPTPATRIETQLYSWGGRLHNFPQDIDLPSGGVLLAWQHWCCGNSRLGYPPYQTLEPTDFTCRNKKKRLSDLRFLMKMLQEEAVRQGVWPDSKPTLEVANEIYLRCRHVTDVAEESSKSRKRRVSQLTWLTVATIKRNKKSITVGGGASISQVVAATTTSTNRRTSNTMSSSGGALTRDV